MFRNEAVTQDSEIVAYPSFVGFEIRCRSVVMLDSSRFGGCRSVTVGCAAR
jgi:hypothetical protein